MSFYLPSSVDEFLSSNLVLDMNYTIVNADGSNLAPGTNVGTQTMPFISFFSDIELSVAPPFCAYDGA